MLALSMRGTRAERWARSWLVGAVCLGACSANSRTEAPPPPVEARPVPADSEPLAVAPSAEPAPWRLESSLGLELEVPATWAINDYECNMSQAPTVTVATKAASPNPW